MIPRTFNIFLLIATIIFLYAVIGMELFAFLRDGSEINSFDQNYQNLGLAIFSLVKFSIL